MPLLLYIPGAFLFPKTFLRIGRTSSVRSRTFSFVLVCTEMPTETTLSRVPAHARPDAPRHRGKTAPGLCGMVFIRASSIGERSMRTARPGDRVQVHYVKRFQDGSVTSSRERGPLEVTIGVDHPRLPGLGLALVGLSPGTRTTI